MANKTNKTKKTKLAAPFKVLLKDQKRIVCIEFQWRLFVINLILSLKVAIVFENRQDR